MNVLVISAHPDDETLGCGGTLLGHREQGDDVHWVVATAAHEPRWSAEAVRAKKVERERVAEAYGFRSIHILGFPAAQLDTVPFEEVMRAVEEGVTEVRPGVLYVVHAGDVHSDHRILHQAVLSVLKPSRMVELGVQKILAYETLSSTEAGAPERESVFIPTVYRDISAFMDRKVQIMELYASEAHSDPMPRGPSAMRALARYRGATVGVEYAEAFMLIREVV